MFSLTSKKTLLSSSGKCSLPSNPNVAIFSVRPSILPGHVDKKKFIYFEDMYNDEAQFDGNNNNGGEEEIMYLPFFDDNLLHVPNNMDFNYFSMQYGTIKNLQKYTQIKDLEKGSKTLNEMFTHMQDEVKQINADDDENKQKELQKIHEEYNYLLATINAPFITLIEKQKALMDKWYDLQMKDAKNIDKFKIMDFDTAYENGYYPTMYGGKTLNLKQLKEIYKATDKLYFFNNRQNIDNFDKFAPLPKPDKGRKFKS